MNIELKHEITFSLSEDSDIFLFVKSSENNNEVAYDGITFNEILEQSFEDITDPEERRTMCRKISDSMTKFIADLKTRTDNPPPKMGEIWRNNRTNKVFMIRKEASLKLIPNGDYTKVADFAHQNDDMSYMCGSDYCRCIQ